MSAESYHNRMLDWFEEGTHIQDLVDRYEWKYRKKICTKCPASKQKELNCLKIDNYRDGIQETYCDKMTRARGNKFRKIMYRYTDSHPARALRILENKGREGANSE